jgi:hypothetical protein
MPINDEAADRQPGDEAARPQPGDDAARPQPGGDDARPRPGVCQGREACLGQLRQALLDLGAPDTTARDPAAWRPRPRDVWLVDRHFADWPLDEPAVLDHLSGWLRQGGRCLHLVGLDFDTTARALPRFARWRRDWSHRIEVGSPVDGLMPAALRGLVTADVAWQWLDAPDWRLRQLTNPVQIRAFYEEVADFLQRCEPAWPATTLGL